MKSKPNCTIPLAYLFDLDGTLIETEALWTAAAHKWMLSCGKDIDYATVNRWVLGRSWFAICDDIFERFPDLRADPVELAKITRAFYFKERAATDIRIHSSVELLRRLSKTTPCVIVSGSAREDIREAIDIMGVADCLKFYLGYEDYPRSKPDPICFLVAAERLGVAPEECVVFEDSASGILSGKNAGMTVVALSRPCAVKQDTSLADVVLEDLNNFRI